MAKIAGWYYDNQLDSPLTSASLHANMWWDNEEKKFINWNLIKGNNNFGTHGNDCDNDVYETLLGAVEGACGYGVDPICTSILNEDFNVAISNTWSDFGGDPIGELWNSVRGPMSGVAGAILEAIDTLFANNEKVQIEMEENRAAGREDEIGWIKRNTSNALNWTKGKFEKVRDMIPGDIDPVEFLNKALVTNGTRFSYYGGTGIAFGNLGMKFTIFPKYDNGKFINVRDQITKLYPYFIGQMESFAEATSIKPDPDGSDPSVGGFIKEAANRVFMFQKPPGGYQTEMNGVDKIQKGTLKLKIGSYYEISNLVCSDVMLNFSKNMIKDSENNLSPLFCDVTITLRPSTKYSDKMLRAFINGDNSQTRSINKIIKENITNEENKIKSTVNPGNPNYMIDQYV